MSETIVQAIESRITEAFTDWEEGRLPSPSSRDLVIYAAEVMERGYRADDLEFLADEVDDRRRAGAELHDIAVYLSERLK